MSKNENPIALMVRDTSEILTQIVENPELLPDLKPLDLTSEDRVDAAHLFIEKLKSERAFYKEQADKYQKVVRTLDKIHEQAKDSIKIAMVSQGVDCLEGNTSKFRLVEIEPRLEYQDELVSPEYKIQVVTTKIDDSKLRKDLASGKIIEGAKLIANFRLTPYVNRKIKAAANE